MTVCSAPIVTQYCNPQFEMEIMVCCPACKNLEMVYFSGGAVMANQRYRQEDEKLYHDCGATIPCRLFRYA
jgi:hypothetical protein